MSKMGVVIVGEDQELAGAMASAIQFGLEEWGFLHVFPTKAVTGNSNYVDTNADEAEQRIDSMFDALEAISPKLFKTPILLDIAPGTVNTTAEVTHRYSFDSKEVQIDHLTRESEYRTFVCVEPPTIIDNRPYRDPWGDDMIRSASGRFHN